MIALLLYVLNMQENSRCSLGEGCYNRKQFTKILALALYVHAFVIKLSLSNPQYNRKIKLYQLIPPLP